MSFKGLSLQTVAAFLIGVFLATAGTATAARVITGKEIKNGSITEKDLATALRQKLSVQVIEGPRGEAGATGARGEAGPAGPKGETGPAGAKGSDGAPGPKGEPGADGAPGAKGADGVPGAKGDTGATGATGASGSIGPIGPQGVPGIPGAKGDKGDKGDTGATGPAGTAAVIARFGTPQSVTAEDSASATASCLLGEVAIGGAGYITGANPGSAVLVSVPTVGGEPMGPTLTVTAPGAPTGWRVDALNGPGSDEQVVAEVLCAPGPLGT
jgi:Collagen triple helix repeat (20 copies)